MIIVGTHADKLNRAGREELVRCQTYIRDKYGLVDESTGKKDGFPQVRGQSKGLAIVKLWDVIYGMLFVWEYRL